MYCLVFFDEFFILLIACLETTLLNKVWYRFLIIT